MKRIINLLSWNILIIILVSCEKEEIGITNKAYLDFLKDKSISEIKIVDNTIYIESIKKCETCGPKEHNDTIYWTVIKQSSFETYLDSDFSGVPQKDSKGNYYIGSYKSLYKLSQLGNYELILNTGDFYFQYFTIDKQDNIWFYGDNDGIAYWNHSKLEIYNSENTILPSDYYHCNLAIDESNNVWVASIGSAGLIKIESDNWTLIPGSEIPGFTEYSYLSYPLVDNENGVWFEVYSSSSGTKFVKLIDDEWTLQYPPTSRHLIKDSENVMWAISYQISDGEDALRYLSGNQWNEVEISSIDYDIITVNADNSTIYIGTSKGLFEISK